MKNFFKGILAFLSGFIGGFGKKTEERLALPARMAPVFRPLFKLRVGPRIRITPGRHHAFFESNIGPIRKQIKCAHETPCLSRV